MQEMLCSTTTKGQDMQKMQVKSSKDQEKTYQVPMMDFWF